MVEVEGGGEEGYELWGVSCWLGGKGGGGTSSSSSKRV